MKYCFLLLLAFFAAGNTYGQGANKEPYAREWQEIDSLLNRGLPQSAEKLALDVYNKAAAREQSVQMVKAQLYLLNAAGQRSEEPQKEAIEKAEAQIAKTSFPVNAIWQSITAQMYWNYYQANRWKILGRTQVSSAASITDFEQWDAERFFQKIISLYNTSLTRTPELKKIAIAQYDPILVKGTNTRNLRPTLFDLLAFRAIEFYANDEKDLTQPAYRFVMGDRAAFSSADEFVKHTFSSQDSLSMQWNAMTLFQQIMSLHISDATADALIDADLQRLAFVYRYSVLPDKKEYYDKALEQIEKKHGDNPLSAMASFQRVMLMMQQPVTYARQYPPVPVKNNTNYVAIKNKLESIINKHPGSEGAINAAHSLENIISKSLAVQAEEVILPNEPSKFLLGYKNISQVWVRVVAFDADEYNTYIHRPDDERQKAILATKPIQEFEVALPGTADLDDHNTEIKLDALPQGFYALIVSADKSFTRKNNPLNITIFQSSVLSMLTQRSGTGYVLNRKTGEPVGGAAVTFYTQSYNNKTGVYEPKKALTVTSSTDGSFGLSMGNTMHNYNMVSIEHKSNKIWLSDYLNFYKDETKPTSRTQTFFFTDRAIFRPGQTIYYKGIMVNIKENGKRNNVIADQKTEVIFYDVNGQQIASQKLTTNEYGSFTGSFTAPEGMLNGNMRISNNTGEAFISVEEYKRPKFAVSFNTLKNAVGLNERITVSGKATAYAGNAIDNAAVRYRVVRTARWPFWWSYYRWGMPASAEMEIAQGTAKTDADGSFDVTFTTIPDLSVDEKSLPIFNYIVYADVTDISGETRSASQNMAAGYVSTIIRANIPEKSRPEDLTALDITTLNLDDNFISLPLKVRISKLKEPGTVLRKRLWIKPDQYTMDSITFRRYFPLDEYRDETDHTAWAVDKTAFENTIITSAKGKVTIPQNTWSQNGWYVIEMEVKDKNGQAVTEKKYIQVWSKNNSGNVAEALLVVPQEQSKQPGELAEINAMSSFKNAVILRHEINMEGKNKTDQLNYDGNVLTWSKTITEEDRGGIMLQYFMVKENRVYVQHANIKIPWSNRKLNISWETHRDKLQPGQAETWTMVVKGSKKEKVMAEMVATMYDASLDAFRPLTWNAFNLFPVLNTYSTWNTSMGFGTSQGSFYYDYQRDPLPSYSKMYDAIMFIADMQYGGRMMFADAVALESVQVKGGGKKTRAKEPSANKFAPANAQAAAPPEAEEEKAQSTTGDITVRSNLNETAFFLPQLRTDEQGNVRIQFTMPEALTEWKMMAFAHTKDMSHSLLEGKIKTQKDLMVMPNLPRFLRQGDEISISSKISNLSDKQLNGIATLQILDAQTLKPLDLPFRLSNAKQKFSTDKERSTAVIWKVHVPQSLYQPVIIRITAQAGNFTDGEESILPILTNRMLVTETLPLPVNGSTSKEFKFSKLLHADTSKTISQYKLTLEYTANPAWYAVQALPYLMEYPYECAEQTFNRFYATALAAHIVDKAPRVKEIFNTWRTLDTAALLSNLEKNQELKTALLEETPWVLEAKNETEQKKRIALLFEANKLSRSLNANMKKLKEMQLADGSFPWFKGMYADRHITQYIVTGLLRLQHLGVGQAKGDMQYVIDRALPYLDAQIGNDYDALIKTKADLSKQHISYHQVQYLYMRSFVKGNNAAEKAYNYYMQQAAKFWPSFNPYMKGMIAIALYKDNNKKEASDITKSLKETAIVKEEMGMYWLQRGSSYWWYEAPIEAQALLIEAFDQVTGNTTDIDAMKLWLLKQKQTQNWNTTKATSDACYALLLQGTQWLNNDPQVVVNLGDKTIDSKTVKQEKGTGYFKTTFTGEEIKPGMGNIKVTVNGNDNSTSWGTIYWQYFEDMDKVSAAKTPLEIKKQLFVEKNTDRGPVLQPITAGNTLKVGDKVKARIEIIVDRDMEYVHLKDMLASCFEPVNVISSYKWQGGLGYYESTKDASTNFFFGYLQKGKYVFEYPVNVMASGEFSNGIATIQCMYAPEFSSHTEGIKIKVAAE